MVVPSNASSPSYTTVDRLRKSYRGGFRSSICSLFANPFRRSDCCALACCGVLQSDKNRYLLHGERPVWWRRVAINILPFVVLLPLMTVLVALQKNNDAYKDPQSAVAISIHVVFWLLVVATTVVCIRARNIRTSFRRDVMNRILEERNNGNGTTISTRAALDGLGNATACCGCYHNDVQYTLDDPNNETEHDNTDEPDYEPDFCTRLFQNLGYLCCGVFCQCWCQFCGMCAIGQEEREISALVPKETQLIDYMTFEPFLDYYPKIVELRRNTTESFLSHLQAVSKLSRKLLITFGIVLLLLTVLALTRIDKKFEFDNLLILFATFLQSFAILYFVHWRWHRFDLSFDAVVKLFSSGFVLGISLALVYEWILQLLFCIIFFVFVVFDISAEMPTNMSQDDLNKWVLGWLHSHLWLFLVAVFFFSFVVAALTEELCKYFSFWMVEHPDFMEKEDWNATASLEESTQANGASATQREVQALAGSARERTLKSKGSAITIAMVTAALGFACCENLTKIFTGNAGTSLGMEARTLLIRCLFPVHPLAAAIQSIGVCQRDLEGDKSIGVGKIILPAVLLHGTFDFTVFLIALFIGWRHLDDLAENDDATEPQLSPEDTRLMYTLLLPSCIGISVIGALYYMKGSRSQTSRLEDLDRNSSRGGEEGIDIPMVV